jgi:uncharacterized Tic20 family protein
LKPWRVLGKTNAGRGAGQCQLLQKIWIRIAEIVTFWRYNATQRGIRAGVSCPVLFWRREHLAVAQFKGERHMDGEIAEVTQDSKNTALLVWIGTIFFGFIPGLILFLVKKDDPYVLEQSKEALNWSITATIGYVAGIILTMILIGVVVMLAVGICHLVFCIMGAVAASNGKNFRAPFAIRLIK